MSCENVSWGICGQCWPRSACASMQSDQGLHCLLTDSLDTKECTKMKSKGPYDTLHMGRMIGICAISACSKALFRLMCPYYLTVI